MVVSLRVTEALANSVDPGEFQLSFHGFVKLFDTVQHPDFQSPQCNSLAGSVLKYPMKM